MSKSKKKPSRKRKSWKRRALLLCLCLPVLYVLGSGPALWSRSQISNKHWKKGVIYYVAPMMWANYQMRQKSMVERVGLVDFTRSDNTQWYQYLEAYWSIYGEKTRSEANKITMMLKLKFRGS